MSESFITAQKMISAAQNIVLSTHEEPDADGLGSMLALEYALRKINKNPVSFSQMPLSKTLSFLPGQENIKKILPYQKEKIDLIIGLDYGSIERLEIKKQHPDLSCLFLTFDHHCPGKNQPGFKIIDTNCSSTSELIYKFLVFSQIPIDNNIATCLLSGIVDDTGAFQHTSTTAETLKIASQLMLCGARWKGISEAKKQSSAKEKALALSQAFENIEIDKEYCLASSFISYSVLQESNSGFKETKIVGFLNSIAETKIAVFLIEKTPGVIDVSLRSQKKHDINVAKIARHFGGGGHKLAAGFRTDASNEQALVKIKSFLEKNKNELSLVD